MPRRRKFNSENSARSFAKKVNGRVNDLREIKEAKAPWSVTFETSAKTKAYGQRMREEWCPEEGRDFGYPNEYWQ